MSEDNQLFEKALITIVDKNYVTEYLLRKTLNIDKNHAAAIMYQLESEGYVSPTDSLLRRFVKPKAFDYVRRRFQNSKSNQSNNNRKESNNAHSSNKKSAYDTLGLKVGASKDEIEKAYRAMARMYHPDKVTSLAPEYMEIAERRMKEINAAYQELKKEII